MAAYVPGAISGLFQAPESSVADALFSKPVASSIPAAAMLANVKVSSAIQPSVASKGSNKKKNKKEVVPRNTLEQDSRTLFVGNIPLVQKALAAALETEGEGDSAVKSEDALPSAVAKENGSSKLLKKLEKRLRVHFMQFGQVTSIRLRALGIAKVKVEPGSDFTKMRRVAAIKSSLDEKAESCIGYVVFKEQDSVDKALVAGGKKGLEFEGNHLRLDKLRLKEAEEGETPASSLATHKGVVFERKKTVFVGNLMFECTEEEVRAHFDKELEEDDENDKPCVSVRIIRDPKTNLGKGFAYVLLSKPELVKKAVETCDGNLIRTRAIRVTKCERSSQKKDEKNAKKREAEELAEAQGLPKSGAEMRVAKKAKAAEKKAKAKLKKKRPSSSSSNRSEGAAAKKPKTGKGDLIIDLFAREAPDNCRHFCQLCVDGELAGQVFARIVPDTLIQTSSNSHGAKDLRDEFHSRLEFRGRGFVALSRDNPSELFVTLKPTPWLNRKHTIIGTLRGASIYTAVKIGNTLQEDEVAVDPVRIESAHILEEPFDSPVLASAPVDLNSATTTTKADPAKKRVKLSFGDEEDDEEIVITKANAQVQSRDARMMAQLKKT
ncbi:hypothetical protein BASA81_012351 [Batrachochytrium salamandrivorans]|nr:hypothetical protein BASA81_012351 [Batrachochytrium salamandrivorans]